MTVVVLGVIAGGVVPEGVVTTGVGPDVTVGGSFAFFPSEVIFLSAGGVVGVCAIGAF